MSLVEISLVFTIFCTVLTVLLYSYLYKQDKIIYIKYWLIGWILYLISKLLFVTLLFKDVPMLSMGEQITKLLSTLLFTKGLHSFKRKEINKKYNYLSVASIILVIICWTINTVGYMKVIPSIVVNIIIINIGVIIIRSKELKTLINIILAYILIIWGIHDISSIFVMNTEYLNSLEIFFTSICQFIVTTLLILSNSNKAKKKLEAMADEYKDADERYKGLFYENHSVMLLICPKTGNIDDVNNAACDYYGYRREELMSMNIQEINISLTEKIFNSIREAENNQYNLFYFKHRLANGEIHDVEVYSGPIRFKDKYLLHSIVHDVTDRIRSEEKILNMAFYDNLTELPNCHLFTQYLNEAVLKAKANKTMITVFFLDFDRFKNINDALGHFVGDKLLKAISIRLTDLFGEDIIVSRLGGDEFIVFLPDIKEKSQVEVIANSIIDAFKMPIKIDDYELYTTVSIGISTYPNDGADGETLIKNADAAMYKAKEAGRDNYKFYTKDMKKVIYDTFQLANSLRGALDRNELEIHYQPKVDMKNEEVIGMEALLRWKHPILGYIPPTDFIPIAEETGHIISIGEWVLKTACRQNKLWHNKGLSKITVAVNISARQLQQNNLYEKVVEILEEVDLEPKYLELEITESIAMRNMTRANCILGKLKEMGINIAMDDFGTGYSSLSYLNQINLNTLKIDKSFIQNLDNSSANAEIAEAIIRMAHSLGLKVTAEGVETKEHIKFLKMKKCDYMQGFFFSKPLPAEDFEKLLEKDI